MRRTRAAAQASASDTTPVATALSTYLREIKAYPVLSRDKEAALAARIRCGDRGALDALVCANLRFVVSIARQYADRGVALADLIDEGNLGLIRSAERFDDTRGVKFISYAVWWVRQSIAQAVAEHAHAFRVPLNRAGVLRRIRRRANTLRHELGREPTQRELAAGLDLDEAEIESTLAVAQSYLSLDAPLVHGEVMNLLEVVPDVDAATADNAAIEEGLAETVEHALARLRPREARVLRLYYGFDGDEPLTLEAIGSQLGVTRERVRQLKERGLSRLRRTHEAGALQSFRER